MELESSIDDPAAPPMDLESSIEDPAIRDTDLQPECEVKFQLIEEGTNRGRVKLIDSLGYTYNIKMRRPNVTYWQCTVRPKVNPCKAVVTQRNGTFVKSSLCHNHPASTGSATTTKVTSQVKKLAVQDLFKPASSIVDEVISLFKIRL